MDLPESDFKEKVALLLNDLKLDTENSIIITIIRFCVTKLQKNGLLLHLIQYFLILIDAFGTIWLIYIALYVVRELTIIFGDSLLFYFLLFNSFCSANISSLSLAASIKSRSLAALSISFLTCLMAFSKNGMVRLFGST